MNGKKIFLSTIAAMGALFAGALNGGGSPLISQQQTQSRSWSINGQMTYERERKHGTMSRRLARNKVMGRHTYA